MKQHSRVRCYVISALNLFGGALFAFALAFFFILFDSTKFVFDYYLYAGWSLVFAGVWLLALAVVEGIIWR